MENVKEVFGELVEQTMEGIKEFYQHEKLDFIKDRIVLSKDVKEKWSGIYYKRNKTIEVNLQWAEQRNIGDLDIKATIAHEIGHYIHDEIYHWVMFKLPTGGKRSYAYTDFYENFAVAFEDYFLHHRISLRQRKFKELLDRTNNLVEIKPKELKNKVIVIYNRNDEEAYRFNSFEEAQRELVVFSLKDLKYICNKGEKRHYSYRSKYRDFNGFTFTVQNN